MRAAMTRRTQYFSPDDDDEADIEYRELESPEIETGTLAIQPEPSAASSSDKDLWTKGMNPYTPGRPLIEIIQAKISPEDERKSIKRYVIYILQVAQNTKTHRDLQPVTIERRYTDFLNLNTSLRQKFPEIFAEQKIYFPKKVLMGNFSPDLIAQRGEAFECFLEFIVNKPQLRDSQYFIQFLQNPELSKACQLLEERRNELAVPIMENCFTLMNKIYMDRSRPVLLILCRLVTACTTSPVPYPTAEKWVDLALRRYEGVCDADLLSLYIPLLDTAAHLWWQKGRDKTLITERLTDLARKGINVTGAPSLTQAIHKLDPRTEII
ncbi:SNX21 family protein [Megaselia abdita]